MTIGLLVFSLGVVSVQKVPAETGARPDLIFAYSRTAFIDVAVKDAAAALQIYADEISRQLGYSNGIVIYDHLETVISEVRNGNFDMVALPSSLEYLLIQDKVGLELALGGLKGGKMSQKYLLLTHQNRGYTKLGDLKHKKLTIPKGDSVAELFLNTTLLRQKQGEMRDFFSPVEEKAKSSQALLSVFFGQADACIATEVSFQTMVEMNPQVGKNLKVMASSPELVTQVSVYRKSLREDIKQNIRGLARSFKQSERGRQMFLLFKIDDLAPLNDSDLTSLKELASEYERLKGQR
jgi:phosphonate transport system substrate-binding protein